MSKEAKISKALVFKFSFFKDDSQLETTNFKNQVNNIEIHPSGLAMAIDISNGNKPINELLNDLKVTYKIMRLDSEIKNDIELSALDKNKIVARGNLRVFLILLENHKIISINETRKYFKQVQALLNVNKEITKPIIEIYEKNIKLMQGKDKLYTHKISPYL